MSRYALLGRISRMFRGVIAGQVPHDLASQVLAAHAPDVEKSTVEDSEDPASQTVQGQDVERRVEVAT